jgi:hypothetical protein
MNLRQAEVKWNSRNCDYSSFTIDNVQVHVQHRWYDDEIEIHRITLGEDIPNQNHYDFLSNEFIEKVENLIISEQSN